MHLTTASGVDLRFSMTLGSIVGAVVGAAVVVLVVGVGVVAARVMVGSVFTSVARVVVEVRW